MIRGFLFHLIPLLVPFIVYGLYLYYIKQAGGEATVQGRTVAMVTLVGLVLMSLSFIILYGFTERTSDGVYVPPRYENGKLIDSQIIPQKAD
jgi:Family of unknown function (DUF6111)